MPFENLFDKGQEVATYLELEFFFQKEDILNSVTEINFKPRLPKITVTFLSSFIFLDFLKLVFSPK